MQHLYLCSISKFHINGACGHEFFSQIFNIPSIYTHDYTNSSSPQKILRLSVPSRYFDRVLNRDLTFSEQLKKVDIKKPINQNLVIVHPSDKEILKCVVHFCNYQLKNKKFNKTKTKLMKKLNKSYYEITKEKIFPFSIIWASKYEHLFE